MLCCQSQCARARNLSAHLTQNFQDVWSGLVVIKPTLCLPYSSNLNLQILIVFCASQIWRLEALTTGRKEWQVSSTPTPWSWATPGRTASSFRPTSSRRQARRCSRVSSHWPSQFYGNGGPDKTRDMLWCRLGRPRNNWHRVTQMTSSEPDPGQFFVN